MPISKTCKFGLKAKGVPRYLIGAAKVTKFTLCEQLPSYLGSLALKLAMHLFIYQRENGNC